MGMGSCNSFHRGKKKRGGTLSLISFKLRIGKVALEAISTDLRGNQ